MIDREDLERLTDGDLAGLATAAVAAARDHVISAGLRVFFECLARDVGREQLRRDRAWEAWEREYATRHVAAAWWGPPSHVPGVQAGPVADEPPDDD